MELGDVAFERGHHPWLRDGSLRLRWASSNAALVVFGEKIRVENNSALSLDGYEQQVRLLQLALGFVPPKAEVESRVEPNVVCQLLNVESRQNVGEVRTQLLPVKVGNVVLVCNGRLATFPFKVASSNLFARAKAGDWRLIFRSRRFNSRCTAPRAAR